MLPVPDELSPTAPSPLQFLLWSNLVMAGSASGWVLLTIQQLDLPMDGVLVLLAFVLTIAFYTRDRLDASERMGDRITMPYRTAWTQAHAHTLRYIVAISLIVSVALLLSRPRALLPIVAGLGFALSYTVRWIPWRGQRFGWKHLPAMKMPFVALLWTLLTVLTPAATYGASAGETLLLAGAVCALIMLQILLNDLRDVEGDRAIGTLSLPVLIGLVRARQWGYGLSALALLLGLHLASPALFLTSLYSLFLLAGYRRESDDRWRPWIEGQGIVAGLIVVVQVLAQGSLYQTASSIVHGAWNLAA